MKKFIVILMFLSSGFIIQVSSQNTNDIIGKTTPILQGRVGPLLKEKLKPILIINNVVIQDTIKIERFRQNYLSTIRSIKYFNKEKAQSMFGIRHNDGVLKISTKKNTIIEL